jgi:N-sulfoglucosamine sulfohydrolase
MLRFPWQLLLIAAFLPALLGAKGKNVVLIVADDAGRNLGCYGDRVAKTPHLDALAAEGTRFSHAFCTTASCSASRSVILTGLQNHANGQYGHQHSFHNFNTQSFVRSLPVLLHEAGYRTCAIGKIHVQPEEVYHFDEYPNHSTLGHRHTMRMAENAQEFIRQDDRPFFLYFCPTDPHRAAKGFANEAEYKGISPVKYDPKEIEVPHFLPDQPEVRAELAEYYQALSRMDAGIGRLMQILKSTGKWNDTLVIFLSDNGIPFPGAKTTLYDPGMRLPLIVRSPDQKQKGGETAAMVTWADLVPTILDYTGAKGPSYPLNGRSFLSTLDERNPAGWDEIFASHTFHEITMYYPMRVVRTRKHKLILNVAHPLPFPFASDLHDSDTWQGVLKRQDKKYGSRTVEAYIHRPQWELYDLEADPQEVVNLAGKPEHKETLDALRAKLKDFQQKTKDPWVVKYDYE